MVKSALEPLRNLVESFLVATIPDLVYILEPTGAFCPWRGIFEREVALGWLTPARLRSRTYFCRQEIFRWWAAREKRSCRIRTPDADPKAHLQIRKHRGMPRSAARLISDRKPAQ